jgi:hypothetical protein
MISRIAEEMAKLLKNEKSVAEKIEDTRGKLGCIRKKISETLVNRYLKEGKATVEEDLMKAEQTYERLMQALLDMKKNFEHQMRSLDEQIVQANVMHLRQVFDEKKSLLSECLGTIDQKVLDCAAHVEEYKRIYADLTELNERLHLLGVDSLELPQRLPSDDVIEVLSDRVQQLRYQGKV